MVKAAYSSGKPAVGVGAGNVPAIIDSSSDVALAVSSVIHSKTFDNGMVCASEQSVIVLDPIYDQVKAEFAARGCYFLKGEETDRVRKTILAGRPWDQPGAGLGSGAPGSASALPLSALHPMRRTGPLPLAQPLQP